MVKDKNKPGALVKDAMRKNAGDKSRVNVPAEYGRSVWSVDNPPSLVALKLLLLLIAECGDDLDGRKDFPLSVLRQVPGLAHMAAPELEQELSRLMQARIRVPFLMLGNSQQTVFGVLIQTAYLVWEDNGAGEKRLSGFAVSFGDAFKLMVQTGELYAVLDSAAVLAMRSRNSVLLYQFLATFWRKRAPMMQVPLNHLRGIFLLGADSYPAFKAFNQRVLSPACAEISALSEYRVTAAPYFEGGRAAVGVVFKWEKKADAKAETPAAPAASGGGAGKSGRAASATSKGAAAAASVAADVLRFWADQVQNGGKRPLSADISPGIARDLLAAGLVTVDQLKARGVNVPC